MNARTAAGPATPTTTPAPAPPRSLRPWAVAAVAAVAIVTAGAFTTLAGLLVGPLHAEFGWSRGAIGVAMAVNMVVYGATAPFAAALMDRFGMRRVIGGSLALIAGGAAGTLTMGEIWQLVLCWGVLVGLGSGAASMVFAATLTERWFVARRGLVAGLLTAASVFGQFVFLPVLSRVVEGPGWRTATLTLAVAAAAATPLVAFFLRDHPADVGGLPHGAREFVPRPPPVQGAAVRAVRTLVSAARTAPFWLLAGIFAVCGASTNGVMWSHFAPAAHDHGMPVTAAASVLALIGIFNVAGTVASGWLTDRYDARRLLAGYFAVRGLSLLVLPLLFSATLNAPLVAFAVVFGLLDVATVPPTIALAREHFGARSAIVFGWVNAGHQLGAGAVAFGGGVARDLFGGYDVVWVTTAALCAAAALLSLVVRKPAPTTRPAP
ncbi:putative MFS-type transporter YhjX [Streptomyces sp. YIM 130001]|uniref:MFS transporter n=1 Tax=Streptomyces sp. YIM 130001 TaxID=2259644 RepID=UPI000E64C931|nr:MFS transporter [Streptomyces sp. YIM 130001]RII19735.1 putative MFS-type transporter YhjX [Streptomyces sp. YIM 130001]